MISLQKVVVITGASGGLGLAMSKAFVAQGWRVVGLVRKPFQSVDPALLVKMVEITSEASLNTVAAEIVEECGKIDVWINNAGIIQDELVTRMSDRSFDEVLETNLKSAFVCARAVASHFERSGVGHLINISSLAAKRGAAGQANYAASKAGMIGLTQSLAREWGVFGGQSNAVFPGVLPTGMTARMKAEDYQKLVSNNVLGSSTSLEEVSRFIVFLAGMRHVSGQIFQLDSRITSWA